MFFPEVIFFYFVNPSSDVPLDDMQTFSRRTDPNGSPRPSIDLRTYPSQSPIHNLPPTLPRNDFPRSGSPRSFLRDHKRISYFDPSNQATVDRLIVDVPEPELDGELEEENAQATLANVEEMLEGYEWVSENFIGKKVSKGAVDLIEARLLDELMALEKVTKPIY